MQGFATRQSWRPSAQRCRGCCFMMLHRCVGKHSLLTSRWSRRLWIDSHFQLFSILQILARRDDQIWSSYIKLVLMWLADFFSDFHRGLARGFPFLLPPLEARVRGGGHWHHGGWPQGAVALCGSAVEVKIFWRCNGVIAWNRWNPETVGKCGVKTVTCRFNVESLNHQKRFSWTSLVSWWGFLTPNLLGVAAAGLLRRSCVAMPMDPSECVAPVLEIVWWWKRWWVPSTWFWYMMYMAPIWLLFLLILDSFHSRLWAMSVCEFSAQHPFQTVRVIWFGGVLIQCPAQWNQWYQWSGWMFEATNTKILAGAPAWLMEGRQDGEDG